MMEGKPSVKLQIRIKERAGDIYKGGLNRRTKGMSPSIDR